MVDEERFASEKFFEYPAEKAPVKFGDHIQIRGHATHGVALGDNRFPGIQIDVDVGEGGAAFNSCFHE